MNKLSDWGYHTIIDAAGCELELINNPDNIAAFAKELVEKIDMVAYGEPQIVFFGEGDKQGYTLIQLIETSNISAHFVNSRREVYMDVFSCKPYDSSIVEETLVKYFKPKVFRQAYIKIGRAHV